MVTQDPIADYLTRIRNAAMASKDSVDIPYSKTREKISYILSESGYVGDVEVSGKGVKDKKITINLVEDSDGNEVGFTGLERVSKPSRRVYSGYEDMKPVKYGHGVMIITTPKGIMTDDKAKKEKVGGEILFKVW